MSNFNKTEYQRLVNEASARCNDMKEPAYAAEVFTQAYNMADEGSLERGRAARGVGICYGKLGFPGAGDWLHEAYKIHSAIVWGKQHPSKEDFRERGRSALYVGVVGLRKAIATLKEGEGPDGVEALDMVEKGWGDLLNARTDELNGGVDQHSLQALPRLSIAESLFRDAPLGRRYAWQAVKLALQSESPRLDTANPNLNLKERLKSKGRAMLAGATALGVSVMIGRKSSRCQRRALAMAQKVLVTTPY